MAMLYDKNRIGYDDTGKAYDESGNVIPTSHDHVLDLGIAHAVCILQAAGVETYEACEGEEGHSYPFPAIRLYGKVRCGHLELAIALKRGWPARRLYRFWNVVENEVVGPDWELGFGRKPTSHTFSDQ